MLAKLRLDWLKTEKMTGICYQWTETGTEGARKQLEHLALI